MIGDDEPADGRGLLALAEALRGRLRRAAELATQATATVTDLPPLDHHPDPAALVALALSPFYSLIWADTWVTVTALILAVLAILRHRANIQRLANGTEPKIGKKKG